MLYPTAAGTSFQEPQAAAPEPSQKQAAPQPHLGLLAGIQAQSRVCIKLKWQVRMLVAIGSDCRIQAHSRACMKREWQVHMLVIIGSDCCGHGRRDMCYTGGMYVTIDQKSGAHQALVSPCSIATQSKANIVIRPSKIPH